MTSPIDGSGTRPRMPQELRSPVLRAHGAAAAASCFARIEETWPELRERYGERGRSFTAEDNLWHLNFLDLAVTLGDPGRFDRYTDWLVEFLVARGLVPEHVAGAYEFLAESLESADCPADQQAERRTLVELLHRGAARALRPGAQSA